ncbi:NYN domain-containing protein [Tautonia plasticadhaerens]|uniref:YacP-like NYN domain protein n=1 Tax=Tautonia plasticadhaerens TaxID=2527974 RepID=A0A518H7E2_9BACT|nr:NYN domain-containing protein [Tautonia plasticadhaerens]QDV36762.1 YacP-like NYN domain protein [Tautonia plasticadhaerens]
MRLLIDGYNLMHAAGRMGRRFGPDGLRRARHRFLDELAHTLGAEQAGQTTLVFDATTLPLSQAPESSHKGMSVIFAVEEDDADTRIELLIAGDSAPRSLTVVSTDRRIRRAAARRRATAVRSDDFLDYLDTLRARSAAPSPKDRHGLRDRNETPGPDERDDWLRIFAEGDEETGLDPGYGPDPPGWTDEDFERIVREVEAEFRDSIRPLPSRSRKP